MSVPLGPLDMEILRRLVAAHAGVALDPSASAIAELRLAAVARREGMAGFRELLQRLQEGGANGLERRVVESLLNTETFFFRDVAPFEALRTAILPGALRRAAPDRTVTVWSAACATGQEPYSVALLVRERLPELLPRLRLVASDFSRACLDRAREGRYSQLEVNRGLPAAYLVKYFEKTGAEWRIDPTVRAMVDFREGNLLRDADVPLCDLILLRNVLIYFPLERRREILDRVRARLKPDGLLLLGATETTLGVDDRFEVVPLGSVSCYRPRDARRGGGGVKIDEADVQDVVRTIWSLTLGQAPAPRAEAPAPPFVAATVRLSGPWDGRVVLRCAPEAARRAAAAMFRTSPDRVSAADVQDAIGELANMAAGNLRGFLPGTCTMSTPRAEDAAGGRELCRAAFDAEGGPFELRVLDDRP